MYHQPAATKPQPNLAAQRSHTPHVYRNPCTRTWICDLVGTRANPGPDQAREVFRTQLDAVQAALTFAPVL